MKCDNCSNPATVHLTEIRAGKKVEKHLCEKCAAQTEGFPAKTHTPINELLTNFVLAHSGGTKETAQDLRRALIRCVELHIERRLVTARALETL